MKRSIGQKSSMNQHNVAISSAEVPFRVLLHSRMAKSDEYEEISGGQRDGRSGVSGRLFL